MVSTILPSVGTRSRIALATKRAMDVAGAGTALTVFSPVLGTLGVLETVVHGWPPLFVQPRPGYRGEIFQMYKFRTMNDTRGPDGNLLPDEQRLTRFGRFLRRTSLDELPELINVLKGEMSLVGPRPLLVEYLDKYTPEQMRRHEMPPGITGWTQINGRNALSWDEKFELDLWYVDHWTLGLDLRILAATVVKVLKREGIGPPGRETMPRFEGSRPGFGSKSSAGSTEGSAS